MDLRYRSMDTLRAVAILSVLLAHTVLSYGAPTYLAPLQFGGNGVYLFFVLSGWLLGGQLFKEINRDGFIDIKRFWIRRWMRTLPAYYAVLLFTIIQQYTTKENFKLPIDYLAFLQNYDYPLEIFYVSWSLCVEEQFYLLIAPLLALLALAKKEITTITLLVLVMLPYMFREFNLYSNPLETHVNIDGCVTGVLLAQIHYQYQSLWAKIVKLAPYLATLSFVMVILFILGRYYPFLGIRNPDRLLLATLFGFWVIYANANEKWRNILYFPGANYIATRSYAMYLLHPEVLALLKRTLPGVNFAIYFTIALIGTLILSEILFKVIEKPIMDLREKFNVSRAKHFITMKSV